MALIKCSECGHEVSDKASVCPNCGCPIEKGLVCNDCGYSLSPTDKTCPNCGCPVKGSKIGAKWKKPLFAAVALVAVLGMAYGIWAVQNGGLKEIQITQGLTDAVHRYDEVSNFHEGLSAVCKSQKWGYINAKGEEVIPCKYVGACDFSEGLACVYLEGDDMPIAFIDKKGHIILEGFFGDTALGEGSFWPISFKDGKCFVYDKDRHDIWINKKGQIVDEPQQSESVVVEPSDYEVFYEDGKYGIKDSLGNVIVTAKYSYINEYSQGLAVAYLDCDDKTIYGLVDKKGNDTFTKEDLELFSSYRERELQRAKQAEEERKRQEEELRRQGREVVIVIGADVDGVVFENKYCSVGECSYFLDQIISKKMKVPDDKILVFKRCELNNHHCNLGYIGVDVYDKYYNAKHYCITSCGEFTILGGEFFRLRVSLNVGPVNASHLEAKYYFREKDKDQY